MNQPYMDAKMQSKSISNDSKKFKGRRRELPSLRLVTRDHLIRLARLVFNFQMYFTPFCILIPPRRSPPPLLPLHRHTS
jgi:hypothetical protein